MAEQCYLIGDSCIPTPTSVTETSTGSLTLNSNAKSRYLTSCYALWKTSFCELAGAGRLWSSGTSTRYYYFWSIAGTTVLSSYSDSEIGVAGRPLDYTPQTVAKVTRTAYTSRLNCNDGGTVSFELPRVSKTIEESWRTPNGYYEKAGFQTSYGGVVTQQVFNDSGVLHLGGEAVKFNATPKTNYRVKQWYVNGDARGNATSLSITLPNTDVEVVCEFEKSAGLVTVKSQDASIIAITNSQTAVSTSTGTTITSVATLLDKEKYAFIGWFRNEEAEPFETNTTLSVVFDGNDVVYTAKYRSKKTTLSVTATNGGAFNLVVNGVTHSNQTSFTDTEVYEDWAVTLNVVEDDTLIFDKWMLPSGEVSTDSTCTFTLVQADTNTVTAQFAAKGTQAFDINIDGIGEVTYTYDEQIDGGSLVSSDTVELYRASTVTFKMAQTDRIWVIGRILYDGKSFEELSDTERPEWLKSYTTDTATIQLPLDASYESIGLTFVFDELPTYAIPTVSVEGNHSINGTTAASQGCEVNLIAPTPDKEVDGEKKWLSGTAVQFRIVSGNKWDFKYLVISYVGEDEDDTITALDNDTIAYTLSQEIKSITAYFEPKQFRVYLSVEPNSQSVGDVQVSSDKNNIKYETDGDYILVLVDTEITINANVKGDHLENAVFHSWLCDDGTLLTNATQKVKIAKERSFIARFATKHLFKVEGEDDTPIGKITIQLTDGASLQTLELPAKDGGKQIEMMLRCGSTYSLAADKTVDETSYFGGWFDANGNRIDGWGINVPSVVVTEARTVIARYVKEEVWPILRLRSSDTDSVEFNVNGVRTEREQTLQGGKKVELTNPNDFFCDPFSTVLIELAIVNNAERFIGWRRYAFGTVEAPGTDAVGNDFYSKERNLAVVMSEDLHLKPIFYTDEPILVTLNFAEGISSAMGSVSLDGAPIDTISSTIAIAIAKFKQNDEVDLVATPNNGYRFVGWYSTASCVEGTLLSNQSRYTLKVIEESGYTYYAKFERDDYAICRFGESEKVKRMVWHSKRIDVNTPTSFAVAKVDAEGYDAKSDSPRLSIFKASSPDVPQRCHSYLIKDSNTRRLAIDGRGEKAYEFEVSGMTPINKVQVATSVTSLLGGA